MKKLIGLILSLSIVCSLLIFPANASSELSITDSAPTIITFEDGSYLTISPIQSYESNSRAITTKNAYQLYTFTNTSGELEWEFVLNATFNYVYGTSVTCTAASYDYTIYANSWKFSDGSASYSGATAHGYGTFKNKVLFITTKTINAELEITCDVYGNLS
jgi:hypothetical protein